MHFLALHLALLVNVISGVPPFPSIDMLNPNIERCPFQLPCRCRPHGIANCSSVHLDFLPTIMEASSVTWNVVDISKNFIETLPDFGFLGFRATFLNLEHNRIHTISPFAFHNMRHLEVLDLSHNMLTSIRILPLENLRILKVRYNNLSVLGIDVMSKLPKLTELDLTGNGFKRISSADAFCPTRSILEKLSMRKNAIVAVEDFSFRNCVFLESLDLGENSTPIKLGKRAFWGLEPKILEGPTSSGVTEWTGLQVLKLDHNGLTTLDSCGFNSIWTLTSLDLSGNPLHCDCALLEFFQRRIFKDSPQCATPGSLSGSHLLSISPEVVSDICRIEMSKIDNSTQQVHACADPLSMSRACPNPETSTMTSLAISYIVCIYPTMEW